jgi:hypothetical protein
MVMKTRLEAEGLTVEFEGEKVAVERALEAVQGTLPTPGPEVDGDVKTPPAQNITRRGVKVNDQTKDRKGDV